MLGKKYIDVKFSSMGEPHDGDDVVDVVFVCVRDEFIHCDAIGKSASTVETKRKTSQIFLTFPFTSTGGKTLKLKADEMFSESMTQAVVLIFAPTHEVSFLFSSVSLQLCLLYAELKTCVEL